MKLAFSKASHVRRLKMQFAMRVIGSITGCHDLIPAETEFSLKSKQFSNLVTPEVLNQR